MPKLKYSIVVPLFVLILFMVAGCGTHEPVPLDTAAVQKQLYGKVWKLEALFVRDVVGEQPLTLEFVEDGTVKGFGGCNNFSGKYTIDGEKISFGPMMSTKKSCGPGTDEQEYTFMTYLAEISTLRFEDDALELYSPQQSAPMAFTSGERGFLW